ncbi:hypothetical protein EXT48_22935 [Pseudoalteromonas sp. CO348]|uniref:hypothetical protein n=1 Tax=Pseudoalteromonas sp. CO348 TaxID=1777271 RepID=UPI00102394DB|nr:hypothetical protein [Pseudoalteromonas sp. CO348]RZF98312.1 hypothetical protein EXT48_22935 [Pseudoalteromonas sp. CO348]
MNIYIDFAAQIYFFLVVVSAGISILLVKKAKMGKLEMFIGLFMSLLPPFSLLFILVMLYIANSNKKLVE